MATRRMREVVGRLTRAAPTTTDAELVAGCRAADPGAVAALVARHLPAVRAVCRSVLRNPADADDATQATFLVFVRRVHTVRDDAAVGRWLARVAWRAANRLRRDLARREQAYRRTHVPPPAGPPAEPDLRDAVADEVRRLPEAYRLAVTVCYLGGVPTAEAAARLGWPKGTLLTRLAWARKRLAARLTARGFAPGVGGAGVFVGSGASALADRVLAAAVGGAVPERISTLTEGVVRTMIGTKLKIVLGVGFAAVAVLGLGLGRLSTGVTEAAAQQPAAKGAKTAPVPEPAADPVPVAAKPDPAGQDLIVRRPKGTFSKDVPGYGRVTLTFADGGRLQAFAQVRYDGLAFDVTLDADSTLNRESVVYGVITGTEVTGGGQGEETAELVAILATLQDIPFAFRVRADDDGVMIKDIKCGPLGLPEVLGGDPSDGEFRLIAALVGGKYRADGVPGANPRPAPLPQPVPAPGRKPLPPSRVHGGTVSQSSVR